MAKSFIFLAFVASVNLFTACSNTPATPTPAAAPTALLVPAAVETYSNTKSSAITRAQLAIGASRLHLVGDSPRVVLAEQMPLAAAHTIVRQRASGPTTTAIETRRVWLVILASNYQIIPPGPNSTPLPIKRGCVFTILDGTNGAALESGGEIPCPQ